MQDGPADGTPEMLEIYDENGAPLGIVTRGEAHRQTCWHRVVHLWLLEHGEAGAFLYFQKRAEDKVSRAGLYDLAATGHMDPGETPEKSAAREAWEEIGLHCGGTPSYLGERRERADGDGFHDWEICHCFVLHVRDIPVLTPGPKVSQIVKISLRDYAHYERQSLPAVAALTLDGDRISIPRERWCVHGDEFCTLVVPFLARFTKENGGKP